MKKAHALLSSTSTDRRKIVTSYHDALTMEGNTQKGKILFSANCGRCHTPQEKGGRVGPDLSGINNKTKEELLTDILDPNYAIEPRFVNYVLTTKAGYKAVLWRHLERNAGARRTARRLGRPKPYGAPQKTSPASTHPACH